MSNLLLALLLAPAAYVVRGFGQDQVPWSIKEGVYCVLDDQVNGFAYSYGGACPGGADFNGQAAAEVCATEPDGWTRDGERGATYGDAFDYVQIITNDATYCNVYCFTNCGCTSTDSESRLYSNGVAIPDDCDDCALNEGFGRLPADDDN